MEKNRLEAFSDGVLAIIITIMVLELKVPHGADLATLVPLWPTATSYVLSFVYVGIYWNNHHHLLQASHSVSAGVLWSNLLLLFWLSLLPFTTGWMGENHFARWPTMLYGINLLACAFAYHVLQDRLVRLHGLDSGLAKALGRDIKGKASIVLYALGIAFSAADLAHVGALFFVAVALMWLTPDRRMENAMRAHDR
ncbi:TMEM175 family protein [Trinickia sp. LjRoot230]|uniref:TMEM175 family protein n=1 Tax=Trinickia sp. LjRoot230 TaxID=3342288 RepID=UPI003ECECEC4